jgi:hypothetical protein
MSAGENLRSLQALKEAQNALNQIVSSVEGKVDQFTLDTIRKLTDDVKMLMYHLSIDAQQEAVNQAILARSFTKRQ